MAYPDFYPIAAYVGSPNYSARTASPEAIVLHVAQGTQPGMDSWFNQIASQVSAHFSISKTGVVHQYVWLTNAAWANGVIEAGYTAALVNENGGMNPNRWSVSIEHEGFYPEEPTPAMFEASVQLSAWLFKNVLLVSGATGVAVDRKHILRHGEISAVSRVNCPGWSDLTMDLYVKRVAEILAQKPPVDQRLVQARDLLAAVIAAG